MHKSILVDQLSLGSHVLDDTAVLRVPDDGEGVVVELIASERQLNDFTLEDSNFVALLYCLAGTVMASFGNIIAARNKLHQVPLLPGNTWAMGYGALAMYLAALIAGVPITVEWTATYLLSLLYLVVFGSIIAFWAYLTLIGNIGADRAGYANLVFPLVALAISTLMEGYQWTLTAIVGLGFVLLGNWMVMRSQGR